MLKYFKIGFLLIVMLAFSTNVFSQAWSTFHDGNTLIKGQVRVLDNLTVNGTNAISPTISADSGTTNEVHEIAFTSPVDTTGSNTHNAITIDLTIGNATGGTNAVNGLQIDAITGDAQVTETAINIGSGWTNGISCASGVLLTEAASADSATTNDTCEIAFTTPIDTTGSNTHNAVTIDLAIGNASGGTNAVRGIQIDGITGDAQVTETGINIGSGWNSGIACDSGVLFTEVASADSATTNDTFEIAFTSPIDTTGSNTHNAMTIDLAIGNASGGTNVVTGLQIDAISGDAEVTENGINIGSGFDSGITCASPVIFNSTVVPPLGFLESFGEGADKGFMTLQLDGTAEDGTADVHNVIYVGNGHKINYVPIVAQTAVIAMTANGLNIGLDQTANDGAELYAGVNGASGRGAIIGTTAAFKASLTFQIADVSGTDDFHFGFRRAETVNATFDDYLDVASIGFVTSADPAAIQLETILNNGGTTTTDTTDTLADATSVKFTVLVSAAGVVTYEIDGSAPSTTAAFTFDDGDLVIPFIHFLQHGDLTGDFDIEEFEYALQ